MAKDVVADADRVIWWIEAMVIAPTSGYVSADSRPHLVELINAYRVAKASDDEKKTTDAALAVMNQYTMCINDGLYEETSKALSSYNWYKTESERLEKKVSETREESKKANKEWQTKYDELLEQFGAMKGRYEECGKRLDQIIERAGLKA